MRKVDQIECTESFAALRRFLLELFAKTKGCSYPSPYWCDSDRSLCGQVPQLPCEPTVAGVLEAYVQHWQQTSRRRAAPGGRGKSRDPEWEASTRR